LRITDEVEVGARPAAVFDALTDLERAVPCLPGGWVRGEEGGAREAGLTVRVGAVTPAYRGTLRVLVLDRDARRLVLSARGRDERDDDGVGPASARVEVAVAPAPHGAASVLHVDADLVVRGRVARLGRGVLGEVCRDLTVRFARGLGELADTPVDAEPAPAAPPPSAPPPAPSRAPEVAVAVVAVAVGAAALVAALVVRRRSGTVR
jgi:carbon monoxide dehydrogenase subunit G